jgi:hypothetical protein
MANQGQIQKSRVVDNKAILDTPARLSLTLEFRIAGFPDNPFFMMMKQIIFIVLLSESTVSDKRSLI